VSNLGIFIGRVVASFEEGTLVKLTLGGYKGREDLKKVRAHPAMVRGEKHLSFTFSFKTKDTHKNVTIEGIGVELQTLLTGGFSTGMLISTVGDLAFERDSRGMERLKDSPPSISASPSLAHDRKKEYLVDPHAQYLRLLDITDASGKVRREKNDKFRQVCKFIEVIESLLSEFPADTAIRSVVDIGSGKSYLTFALYDYLVARYGGDIAVRGIEVRKELVEQSARVARECSFNGLSFVHGAGAAATVGSVDMVVALHACDTATDDALRQALDADARIIVVAPCCHKYVRRMLAIPADLKPVLGHGILEARLADSLTDGLRALFLKAHGYAVKVFEFIAPEHTAKNTMITAVRKGGTTRIDSSALDAIDRVKRDFSLPDFYLDRVVSKGSVE